MSNAEFRGQTPRPSLVGSIGDHEARARALEATKDPIVSPYYYHWDAETLRMWVDSGVGGLTEGFAGVTDATAPYGGYVEASLLDDYIQMGMYLGPRWSIWQVAVWYAGTSGAWRLEWATTSVDEFGETHDSVNFGPGGEFGTPRSIIHPYVVDGTDLAVTWFRANAAGAFSEQQTVATGGAFVRRYSASPIIVAGNDGDPLTANGAAGLTNTPYVGTFLNGARRMNMGAGPLVSHRMRLRIVTAPTAPATIKIAAIRVYRRDGDNHAHA